MRLAIEFEGLNAFIHPPRSTRQRGNPWERLAVLMLDGRVKEPVKEEKERAKVAAAPAASRPGEHHSGGPVHWHRPVLAIRTRDIEDLCVQDHDHHTAHGPECRCEADRVTRLEGYEWALWDLKGFTLHVRPYGPVGKVTYRQAQNPSSFPRAESDWEDIAYLPEMGEIDSSYLRDGAMGVAARAIFARGMFACLPPSYWERESCSYYRYGEAELPVTDRAEWRVSSTRDLQVVLLPIPIDHPEEHPPQGRYIRLTGGSVRLVVSSFPIDLCGHLERQSHFRLFHQLRKGARRADADLVDDPVDEPIPISEESGVRPVYCPQALYTAPKEALEKLDAKDSA